MSTPRGSSYKQLLTPALHRRFTGAAIVILILCYIEAVLIGGKASFFWSWFPIGPTGIRTLLLFISALSVFVLRVAQLHMGDRTTASPAETFTKSLFRLITLQTLAWYFFSAWWFSEVYMWSAPASANLGWISEGKAWERKRLNERPVYLRSVFFMLAVLQSGVHLYSNYDGITVPRTSSKAESSTEQPQKREDPLSKVRASLPLLAQNIALRSVCMSIFGPIIYALFIRRTAWSCSLYFATLLWELPASQLSYIPPYHISLIVRSLTSGLLLVTLWEFANALFGAYVAQEPLKKEQPFTSHSKDPNGSLLNGLKGKKEVMRTFALWELLIICQRYDARRKAMFSDIDRPTGSMWNQVMTLCLGNILSVSKRIRAFQNPSTSAAPPQQPVTIETLPHLAAPLRQENIFTKPPPPSTRREKIESSVGTIAKSYGQSPQPAKPLKFLENQRAEGQKYIGVARQKLLTQGQQETLSSSGLLAHFNDYLMQFLRTPAGYPFRKLFRRRVCTVVLGTPHSELNSIVNSIITLNILAVASLKEDNYGKVAKDLPLLIRAYVSTTSSIEGFVTSLPAHWTDVDFSEADRKVEAVDLIVSSLKTGLRDMIDAFGMYATELGLGEGEIRTARQVAGMDNSA